MRNRLLIFLLIFLVVIPLTAAYGEEVPKIINIASDSWSTTSSTVKIAAENPVFKKIEVSGESGSYRVEGRVKLKNGSFYYTVEDGHHQQIQETKEEVSGDGWSSFVLELKIPDDQLPQNGTLILNLYERENETVVQDYSVILERFY
jgi:hypothetical protein